LVKHAFASRIWVSLLVENLAEVIPESELLAAYPQLRPDDIRAALAYAAEILIPSTQFALRSTLPHCVPFQSGEFGLDKDCVAQAETVSYIADVGLGPERGVLARTPHYISAARDLCTRSESSDPRWLRGESFHQGRTSPD
jgi:hypothetical protein